MAIDHVAEDERFCGHPTPEMYGFQSYISVPIRLPDGRFFGTLCGIDPEPARVNRFETIGMFKLFADLIALHLDAQERLTRSETALQDERQRAELQDQFIAVLGHDLRNPLSAIQTGAKTLLTMPLSSQAAQIANVIDRSAARMTGLIHDVLDFARSRLGGGLAVTRVLDAGRRDAMIEEVIAEMRTARPDRTIHSEVAASRPVICDRARIGQLLSNLLANALTHGDATGPVWVRAHCADGTFELSVANQGPQIPPETVARLFQPFARASHRTGSRRPGTRPLYRVGDRAGPRRLGRGHLVNRGNPFHLSHARGIARPARGPSSKQSSSLERKNSARHDGRDCALTLCSERIVSGLLLILSTPERSQRMHHSCLKWTVRTVLLTGVLSGAVTSSHRADTRGTDTCRQHQGQHSRPRQGRRHG